MDKNGQIATIIVASFLLVSVLSAGIAYSVDISEDDFNKSIIVYNRDTWEDFLEKESSFDLIEEYDGFTLLETTSENKEILENEGYVVESIEKRDYIGLQAHSFYTGDGAPDIPENLEMSSYPEDGYYILQFRGPIKSEWVEELEEKGVIFHEFRHRFNFIVEMDSETRRDIDDFDFVEWLGIYQPAYRFDQELLEEDGEQLVEVTFFDGVDLRESAIEVEDLGGEIHAVGRNGITVYIHTRRIEKLANLGGIRSINEGMEEPELYNDDATWITQTNVQDDRKVTEEGITGTGQLITVCDSELYSDHEAFDDDVDYGDDHRKIQEHYSIGGDLYDGVYHGTHVAGTVLGESPPYGEYSNHDGNALESRLIFQDIGTSAGGLSVPDDMYADTWQPSYDSGARAHTNSWGGGIQSYTGLAIDGDEFIWDHKDYNILFAMGNDGPGAETMSGEPEGKNFFSVGGVTNYPNHNTMASFSSRGYADDGRIKPTVLHVAENVDSADRSDTGYDSMSGTSMSTPGIAGQVGQVREYYEEGYHIDGTPNPGEGFNPSNALVRATIINGAAEITGDGAYNNDNRFPNNDQGFGNSRLDRVLSFEGDDRDLIVYDSWDEGVELDSGETWTTEFQVDDPDQELEVTLAWTDYPGSDGSDASDPAIVNDLDLEVDAPDGTRYVGNAFTGNDPGYSEPDPSSNPWDGLRDGEYDGLNVEENVLLLPDENGVEDGTYEVTVTGHNVPQDTQPFALVVSGGVVDAGPTVDVTDPQGGETWEFGDTETIQWDTEEDEDPIDSIDIEYSIDGGNTYDTIASGIDDTGSYEWEIPDETSSESVVRVTAHDTGDLSGSDTSDAFTLLGSPPAPPENLDVELHGQAMGTIFEDDVSEDKGYETTGDENTWDIRDHGSTEGDQSWDWGDTEYEKVGELSSLISPEIEIHENVDEDEGVTLTFDHWRDIVDTWDGVNLKVSTGENFELIEDPDPEYDHDIGTGYGNPIEGESAWGDSVGWEEVTVGLDDYAGETIQLRWDAGVDDWDADGGEGWRIDNIHIEGLIADEDGDDHNLVSWDASEDDPDGVSHYNLYRAEEQDGEYEEIANIDADGSASYEYLDEDKGAADDIYWWYTVEAEDDAEQVSEEEGPVQEPGATPISLADPSPSDGAEGVGTDVELSTLVEHDEGESVDVSFYDGSDQLIGTDNNVADGDRAEVEWDDLDYGTTYEWYVEAEDDNGETAQSSVWSFTTIDAPGPISPTDPEPEDGAEDVDTDAELSVFVDHDEDQDMDVTFFEALNDDEIGTDLEVSSGDRAEVTWDDLDHDTEYGWYAVAEDDDGETAESSVWSFTTEEPGPLPPTDPQPEDGETGLGTDVELSVLVEHESELDTSSYYPAEYGDPPTNHRAPSQRELTDEVLIRWDWEHEGYHTDISVAISQEDDATAQIIAEDQGEADDIEDELMAAGADMSDVEFTVMGADTPTVHWIRDYGPMPIVDQDTGDVSFINVDYAWDEADRPEENEFVHNYADEIGVDVYDMEEDGDITFDGGHKFTESSGAFYSTDDIYAQNDHLTEGELDNWIEEWFNVETVETVGGDYGLAHLDMQVNILDETTVVVSEFEDPSVDPDAAELLDDTADFFENEITARNGDPFEIERLPMHVESDWMGNTYYTHANSLIVNDIVLVPEFNYGTDTEAIGVYEDMLPDHEIIGVDAEAVADLGGAIHCTTREIPVENAPPSIDITEVDATSGDPIVVEAEITTDAEMDTAHVYYDTNSAEEFDKIEMINVGGDTYEAELGAYDEGTEINYFVHVEDGHNAVSYKGDAWNPLTETVDEPEDLTMEVTFFDASDDSVIGTVEDVEHGERAEHMWEDLEQGTSYEWYAESDDGEEIATSETWEFTIGELETHTLTIDDITGEGTVEVDDDEITTPFEKDYEQGEAADLLADPDQGWEFSHWTGVPEDLEEDPDIDLEMDQDRTVTAIFEEVEYTLSIDSTEGGEVIEPGEEEYTYGAGETIDLEAVADEDYHFVEWTGDVETIGDTGAGDTAITMEGDYALTANFETVEVDNVEIIYPTEDQTITAGETITIEAEAYDGDELITDDRTDFEWEHATRGVFNRRRAGEYEVTATYQGETSDPITITVEPAEADRIEISPEDETVEAGTTMTYTAVAYDEYENEIGEVSGDASWSIEEGSGGSWTGNEYTSEVAGEYWTVEGEYEGLTDTALLTVEPGAVDTVELDPSEDQTIEAGEKLELSAEAYDAQGNLIADNVEAFDWENAIRGVFYYDTPGEYEVTASYGDVTSDPVTVTVEEEGTEGTEDTSSTGITSYEISDDLEYDCAGFDEIKSTSNESLANTKPLSL